MAKILAYPFPCNYKFMYMYVEYEEQNLSDHHSIIYLVYIVLQQVFVSSFPFFSFFFSLSLFLFQVFLFLLPISFLFKLKT